MVTTFIEFMENLTSLSSEKPSESSLVCDCELGELHYDPLNTKSYSSSRKCNPRGVCAYVAKSKHDAKISTAAWNKSREMDNKARLLIEMVNKQDKRIGKSSERPNSSPSNVLTVSGYKFKALDQFL